MTRISGFVALASCALFQACVTGVIPPEPTKLVPISGGQFLFGSTEVCVDAGKVSCEQAWTDNNLAGLPKVWPTVLVNVDAFSIDEHEVTNIQYRYCVDMGTCQAPKSPGPKGFEDYYSATAYENFPVMAISQAQAEVYCKFVDRKLPTELQWERVAAGPFTDQASKRSSAISNGDSSLQNCDKTVAMALCAGYSQPKAAMGSADDFVIENGQKIWDLAGNVSEWVSGAYAEDLTCEKPLLPSGCDCFARSDWAGVENCFLNPCAECNSAGDSCFSQCRPEGGAQYFDLKGLPRCLRYTELKQADVLIQSTGSDRPVRGGNFLTGTDNLCTARTTDRSRKFAAGQFEPTIGFRCVKNQAP